MLAGHDFTPYWFETAFGVLCAARLLEVPSLELSVDVSGGWEPADQR